MNTLTTTELVATTGGCDCDECGETPDFDQAINDLIEQMMWMLEYAIGNAVAI